MSPLHKDMSWTEQRHMNSDPNCYFMRWTEQRHMKSDPNYYHMSWTVVQTDEPYCTKISSHIFIYLLGGSRCFYECGLQVCSFGISAQKPTCHLLGSSQEKGFTRICVTWLIGVGLPCSVIFTQHKSLAYSKKGCTPV